MENKPMFHDKSSAFKFFLFLLIFLIWTAIGYAIAGGLMILKGDDAATLRLVQGLSAVCMFVMPPICHYLLTRDTPLAALGLCRTRPSLYLTATLLFLASIPFVSWLTEWNEGMKLPESLKSLEAIIREMEDMAQAETEKMLNTDTIGGLMANLTVIALIAAVGEELTFRGVMQPWLTKACRNPHLGIVLDAIVFSAIHMQFYGFVPRLVLGIVLGYTAYVSRSLWPSILIHFLNNATTVVVMFLVHKGTLDIEMEEIGSTNLVGTILSALATIAILIFMWKKQNATTDKLS